MKQFWPYLVGAAIGLGVCVVFPDGKESTETGKGVSESNSSSNSGKCGQTLKAFFSKHRPEKSMEQFSQIVAEADLRNNMAEFCSNYTALSSEERLRIFDEVVSSSSIESLNPLL